MYDRFNNFIIFEPPITRIEQAHVLITGQKAVEMIYRLYFELKKQHSLQSLIIMNRLCAILKTLDLIANFDSLIITKFYDRLRREYSTISHIGERIIDCESFIHVFSEYDMSDLVIQRY